VQQRTLTAKENEIQGVRVLLQTAVSHHELSTTSGNQCSLRAFFARRISNWSLRAAVLYEVLQLLIE
jgi:hypothetical protein